MSGNELLDAFQRLIRDEVVIRPQITQRVLQTVLRIRQPDSNPFNAVSVRELDILRTLADGASNAHLADHCSISFATVKVRISRILTKLRLADRAEVVAFAMRNSLMNDPASNHHR